MATDNKNIDGRTKEAKIIADITNGLKTQPLSTGRRILTDMVARNTAIEQAIFNRAMNDGVLDESGKLNKQLEKHFLRFQTATKVALTELMRLEGKNTDPNAEDIFSDVFEE